MLHFLMVDMNNGTKKIILEIPKAFRRITKNQQKILVMMIMMQIQSYSM